MRRRRVLIVERASVVGGSVISLYQLLRGLDRTRFEPVVLLPEGNPYEERFRGLDVEVITRPWAGWPPEEPAAAGRVKRLAAVRGLHQFAWGRKVYHAAGFYVKHLPAILGMAEQFTDLLRQVKPGFVHLNDMVPAHQSEILGCNWARVPSLCHVRSFEPLGRFDRWLASRVDRYIFVSQAIAEWFLGLGVKTRAWDVVYNGVDVEEFRPMPEAREAVRAELGLPADAKVAAVVGRLVPWKGQEVFIDALMRLGSEYPSLWGLILGKERESHASFARHLRAKVQTSGMRERVVFAGHRSDVNRVLAGVDVLVHSSVEPEPFGRVIVEGMAAGVPVVASAVGAVRELVEDGRTGLLVPPGDDEGMAQAIERVIGTEELRERLSRNGRREVEARFRSELYVAGVEAVYEVMV